MTDDLLIDQQLFDPGNFDPPAARLAREHAIQQVDEHADMEWKHLAKSVVRSLAITREEFTTDAVWYLLEQTTAATTHEPRALGAVMRAAASDRIIVATDRTVESVRVANHRRPVRIWRSLIYPRTGRNH